MNKVPSVLQKNPTRGGIPAIENRDIANLIESSGLE